MESKKTGMTPLPDADLRGGELIGMMEGQTFMVHYRDGFGQTSTELAIRFPNGDVYFIKGAKFVPAQKWMKAQVNRRLEAAVPSDDIPQG